MAHVPTTNLNALYSNTTSSNPADPNVFDAAIQDIVSTINTNDDSRSGDLTTHKTAATLDHPDKSVTQAKIADKAVGTGQIADYAVGSQQISNGSVGANQLATGLATTADTQAQFNRRAIDVKTAPYNAKGDGVTDDTAAIQSALNSLTNGGIVFLPIGTYNISSTIAIPAHVTLEGAGRQTVEGGTAASVIVKTGSFDGVTLSSGSVLRNLVVTRQQGVTDTNDGIHIIGIGAIIDNVASSNHGGDGIRIGNKNGSSYNANISRLIAVAAYGNSGYGIHYSDDTNPTAPNANASAILGADCRDNATGGIKYENCLDNNAFGVDCEENTGQAGIYIGAHARGINVYTPYTENPSCTNEMYLDANSTQCIIWGCRSVSQSDGIVDNGTNNLILGRVGSKTTYPFIKSNINFNNLRITNTNPNSYGNYHWYQDDASAQQFCVVEGTSVDQYTQFKHYNSSYKHHLLADSLWGSYFRIYGQDKLQTLYSKKPTSSSTTVPANGYVDVTVTTSYAAVGNLVVGSPMAVPPVGITWSMFVSASGVTTIRLANMTSSPVSFPSMQWNILVLDGTTLV